MTDALRAIDCTHCGAGLDVLGGGRVTTQVCGYCGAALDATDAYRVLAVFAGMERPASPFRLGMTGEIDGVAFTIVGTMGMSETWRNQRWEWVDHQIYSPTHGYGWLTVEDGHVLLTRKVRDWPDAPFLTPASVETAEVRPHRVWRGSRYGYYSSSSWVTDFVEGEFTWRPARGEAGTSVALMADPGAMLSYVQKGAERELEITRYAPEAVAAFGAEAPRPKGTHPLQSYTPKPGAAFYRRWFGGLTAASLVAAFGLSAIRPAPVTLWQGAAQAVPGTLTFELEEASRPAVIRLRHGVRNDWAEYDLTLLGPDTTPIADTVRGVSYYTGTDSDGTWREGSQSAAIGFQPTEPGTHVLSLALAETGSPGAGQAPLRVVLEAGRMRPLWLWIVAGTFAFAFLWAASTQVRHRRARWSGSDWSEE